MFEQRRDRLAVIEADPRIRRSSPAGPERVRGGTIHGMMQLQLLIKDRRGAWAERTVGHAVPQESTRQGRGGH